MAARYTPSWSSGGGRGQKGGGAWGRSVGVESGVFNRAACAALACEPEVLPCATYSYVAKSPGTIDVVCPAWSVRRLRALPGPPCSIDLSLERGLAALQGEDGGFEVTPELCALLGLEEIGSALALAEEADARALGALLALKAVDHYKGAQLSSALAAVRHRAEGLVCSCLGLEPDALRAELDAVGAAAGAAAKGALPAAAAAALDANFAPHGRWSFFELWPRLLPEETLEALRLEGGVLCPRFFLVDLACAPWSPYDVDKSYPLVRCGPRLFVGQPASDDGGGRDAMRQGRQLEAALLTFGWLEEDHVITEVRLPGARVVFSAAPDGLEGEGEAVALEPLAAFDDEAYEAEGYSLAEVFPAAASGHGDRSCRLWRAPLPPAPPEAFVEVKKTTHLNGRPGEFKLLKFWLQAALMRCGAVVVATTDGSQDGDTVREVRRLPLKELAARVESRSVWGALSGMLRHVLAGTAEADGAWTLRVRKERDLRSAVRLELSRGWRGEEDPRSILERVARCF